MGNFSGFMERKRIDWIILEWLREVDRFWLYVRERICSKFYPSNLLQI